MCPNPPFEVNEPGTRATSEPRGCPKETQECRHAPPGTKGDFSQQKKTRHSRARMGGAGEGAGRRETLGGLLIKARRNGWGKRRRKRINPFCTYSESLWVIQRMLHPQKPPTSVTF